MDKKNWEDGMSNIDDKLINEAVSYKKKSKNLVPVIGGVAAAAIIAGVGISVWNSNKIKADNKNESLVAISTTEEDKSFDKVADTTAGQQQAEVQKTEEQKTDNTYTVSPAEVISDDKGYSVDIDGIKNDEAVTDGIIHYLSEAPEYKFLTAGNRVSYKLKEEELESFVKFVNTTATAFYEGNDQNYAYSPLSLFSDLCMLMDCENSDGADNLGDFLGVNAENASTYVKKYMDSCMADDKNYCFINDKSAWICPKYFNQDGIDKLIKLSDNYNADVISTENVAGLSDAISKWINENTKGLINSKPDLNDLTSLLLIDTLYLKADWAENIKWVEIPREFTDAKNHTTYVKAMATIVDALYDKTDRYEAVRLKYCDGSYILILLPAKGVNPEELLSKDLENINQNIRQYKMTSTKVELSVPEFNIESSLKNIKDVLYAMGLDTALSVDAFYGLTAADYEMKVDYINQNSNVIVDHNGTVAASATEIGVTAAAAEPAPGSIVQMDVNRPFAFAICSPAGVTEYVGIVNYGIEID